MPTPGSSARGQAPAGAHDFPLCAWRSRGWRAFARHDVGEAADESVFRRAGISGWHGPGRLGWTAGHEGTVRSRDRNAANRTLTRGKCCGSCRPRSVVEALRSTARKRHRFMFAGSARTGRNRNSRCGVRNRNKQTFVNGDWQRQPSVQRRRSADRGGSRIPISNQKHTGDRRINPLRSMIRDLPERIEQGSAADWS
jgi:hypothetical protein